MFDLITGTVTLVIVVPLLRVTNTMPEIPTMMDHAAIDALKQWQYSPLVLNGIKTPFVLTVTFNFSVAVTR